MINKLQSKIALNIKGKNINRFIKKLTTRKIDVLSLKYVSENEINIIIYKKDYEKVLKIKSIYDVLETDVYGYLKIKKLIRLNKHLIIILILGYILFIILTHMIFKVQVIHSNKDIRNLLYRELGSYGIEKYAFKKDYKTVQKIKEDILNKYPDKIEWLEIEDVGTKYVVRVEEREIVNNNESIAPRNLVAKKDGIIKKVIAESGEVVKQTDDYVNKGDVIVSGQLYVNEEEKGRIKAQGKVFAEVWYVLTIDYPFAYFEEKETGNKKENYVIKFLGHEFDLSNKHYKNKKVAEEKVITHPLLPISLVYQKQKEVNVINEVLTFDEALSKAQDKLTEKVESRLNGEEHIIKSKYLKSSVKETSIEATMFFAVYEDITDYKEIINVPE